MSNKSRDCTHCGKPIPEKRAAWPHTMTCSTQCSHARMRRAYRERNPVPTIPKGTVGAIAELAVSVDLLSRGYEVFRALSPHCSCDLAINLGGRLIRVEVRTGRLNSTGGLTYGKFERDMGRQDIYAVRTKEGEITYFPDPETLLSSSSGETA